MTPKDKNGTEIKVGSKIAWASLHGHRAMLKVGIVQNIVRSSLASSATLFADLNS